MTAPASTTAASAIASALAEALANTVPTMSDVEKVVASKVDTHTKAALNTITTTAADERAKVEKAATDAIDRLAATVMDAVEKGGARTARAVTRIVTEASPSLKEKKAGDNVIIDALTTFYTPGVEAPANVLLASPPSFGKSWAIRKLGQDYDVYLEHGCSDDMDEISTLLGSPVPDMHGGFIVVDGVLTEAVRSAASGKTTLLLLDEILRLTPRAQEWLLTFLTGVKMPDGSRIYRLRTRRALPSGELEVIECPTTHLHIVAATNLSILNPIEAFWSRWETVRVEFTVKQAEATAKAILDSYGIDDPGNKLAKMWANIVRESREKVSRAELRFPVDFRMLERAAAMNLVTPTAKAVARFAKDRLSDNVSNWNPETGDVDAAGVAAVVAWQNKLETFANEK